MLRCNIINVKTFSIHPEVTVSSHMGIQASSKVTERDTIKDMDILELGATVNSKTRDFQVTEDRVLVSPGLADIQGMEIRTRVLDTVLEGDFPR
jgi:hypothetical protein